MAGDSMVAHKRRVYLNPDTGRFNRLDPWAGNTSDPQSLHKYLYAHCDPLDGIDPSGSWTTTELLLVVGIWALMGAQIAHAPGPGRTDEVHSAEAELFLFFASGQLLAVPVAWAAKLVVAAVGRSLLAAGRYGAYQFGALWQRAAVYHATDAAPSILRGINLNFVSPGSRFGRAFYVAEQGGTAIAESSSAGQVIRFQLRLSGQRVLDLTDSAVAQRWGYAANAGREATQAIAERAVAEGYTVIKFYSVEVPGTVNYAVFENFSTILTNPEVFLVPW